MGVLKDTSILQRDCLSKQKKASKKRNKEIHVSRAEICSVFKHGKRFHIQRVQSPHENYIRIRIENVTFAKSRSHGKNTNKKKTQKQNVYQVKRSGGHHSLSTAVVLTGYLHLLFLCVMLLFEVQFKVRMKREIVPILQYQVV